MQIIKIKNINKVKVIEFENYRQPITPEIKEYITINASGNIILIEVLHEIKEIPIEYFLGLYAIYGVHLLELIEGGKIYVKSI